LSLRSSKYKRYLEEKVTTTGAINRGERFCRWAKLDNFISFFSSSNNKVLPCGKTVHPAVYVLPVPVLEMPPLSIKEERHSYFYIFLKGIF
jgi:hypothetical protein